MKSAGQQACSSMQNEIAKNLEIMPFMRHEDCTSSPISQLLAHGQIELFEPLFSRLKGGPLLLALLSYDLGVPLSDLVGSTVQSTPLQRKVNSARSSGVRVRDLDLASRSILVAGRSYTISECIVDDLREHLQERLCGYEASPRILRRDQSVFSDVDLAALRVESCKWWSSVSRLLDITGSYLADAPSSELVPQSQEVSRVNVGSRVAECSDGESLFNWGFCVAGGRHIKRARRRGASVDSPLGLFDKGPKIVRRGRAGVQFAYYLWRAGSNPRQFAAKRVRHRRTVSSSTRPEFVREFQ
jgi:hypothetical protein